MYIELLRRHRRALHRIPEIKFELPKTHAYIMDALKGLRCDITVAAGFGVLAYFDGGKSETAAFRADMDALPIVEETEHCYKSLHPGCMHACGHDGHMAMLLVFAEWVNQNIEKLNRNVLLIFQPAEESGGGGEKITDTGILQRLNVKRVFAIHVDPALPAGAIASRPGPFMARASEIHLDVEGLAGHAAVPGAGRDAMAAAVDFVYGAYKADRELPKAAPRRIKFCKIVSGNSTNVIASSAQVAGTMRTFDDSDYDALRGRMEALAKSAETEYGVKCRLNILPGYPAVINDEALYEKACAAVRVERIPEASFLGEDFSYYGRVAPEIMFRLGLGTGIPLHSANFDFDEAALEGGVELFIKLAEME